jgi:hypothetical protein
MRMKKKPWGEVLLNENKDLVMLPEDLDKEIKRLEILKNN